MKKSFRVLKNSTGLSDVPGFQAAAAACDIRRKGNERLDLALVYSATPCTCAGVFTRNSFVAAPVSLCQATLANSRKFHGFVANSGNANACTGKQGDEDAAGMQHAAAHVCGVADGTFLVASTGRIGEFMPMDRLLPGIERASKVLGAKGEGLRAADAILTSDTRNKIITVKIPAANGTITLAGMAKGAGMIQPGMATMLAFLATDAVIPRALLQRLLKDAVDDSFNAITVDGDMSTNDTVLLFANGVSGLSLNDKENAETLAAFREALRYICSVLAEKIVGDGEKITKVVDIRVNGASNRTEAEAAARAIGNSLLVKSSWYGNDPNWGRLLDAVGYSGAKVTVDKVKLWYQAANDKAALIPVFSDGLPLSDLKPKWKKLVAEPRFRIVLELGAGKGTFRLLATDLTEGYVNYNKSE